MRLFVAIFLPDHVRSGLEALSRRFPSPRLRWTAPDSLHITLRFLGETRAAQRAPLEERLERAASACSRFDLAVTGGGVFPDARRPRIFWTGLSGSVDRLAHLAAELEAAAVAAGFPGETRSFSPHLTVARARTDVRCLPADAAGFVAATGSLAPLSFAVENLHLVQSHLNAAGSRYETLRLFPLAA